MSNHVVLQPITLDVLDQRLTPTRKPPSCGNQPAHIRLTRVDTTRLTSTHAHLANEAAAAATVAAAASPCPLDKSLPISVVGWWWLGLEGFIPPPVGALAGGPRTRWHSGRGTVGRTRQRCCAEPPAAAVGDHEILCGSGDGDDTAMVQPMVIRADQHQVEQLGGTAVFPMHDVVGVQTAGGPTTGHRTHPMAVLECAAQPPVDQPRRSPGADDLPVTFEPHFTAGITA